ncbi:adapter molecule Crk [Condylostylus longicornis]|uniref:adapter molecule Crk n=1 Tax=Condylostylus longicornis TaxID=2530218 RepID=UPI00244E5A68|nr:adapter molecule Crk [Condylostylus longicornis]XP_055373828.1 adapter molecule Crk [Condylostylus longicornis]
MSFDIHDRESWYFGPMSRLDATELLMNETEAGVFLVRDSNTIIGDFVLCVREETKVGHYIINKIENGDQIIYRIGDQVFGDLPELLSFYKLHYLDTASLIRPASTIVNKTDRLLNKTERVIAKFDFDGSDQDDLPFRRGEILTIVSKDEDQWWTAKNCYGQIGQIPVPYVQTYENSIADRPGSGGSAGSNLDNGTNCTNIQNNMSVNQIHSVRTGSSPHQLGSSLKKSDLNRKLPALAIVKQTRIPNAYDKTALKLEVGDVITVTKTNINGQWEGELKGKRGHFPFTHVEFIEDNDNNCCNNTFNSTQKYQQQQQNQISPGSNEKRHHSGNNQLQQQQQQQPQQQSQQQHQFNGTGNTEISSNNEWGD